MNDVFVLAVLPGMSMTVVSVGLTIVAVVFYAAIVLYGAWIDGRRQAVREKGLHPVTTPEGRVEAREKEDGGSEDKHQHEDDQG